MPNYQQGQAMQQSPRNEPGVVPSTPTINNTHQESISRFRDVTESLDVLLSKLRGPVPVENAKALDEMPNVMANAGKINMLAYKIAAQVSELHQIIGD